MIPVRYAAVDVPLAQPRDAAAAPPAAVVVAAAAAKVVCLLAQIPGDYGLVVGGGLHREVPALLDVPGDDLPAGLDAPALGADVVLEVAVVRRQRR